MHVRHQLALGTAALAIVGLLALQPSGAGASTQSASFATPGTFTWVVPPGVTSVTVDAFGASGGDGDIGSPAPGGLGGRTTATIAVTPGATLELHVGGEGASDDGVTPAAGGTNGGGAAGAVRAGGGGGATDVRLGGSALSDRVAVAGGGGGGGTDTCEVGEGGVGGGDSPTGGGAVNLVTGGGAGTPSAGGAGGVPDDQSEQEGAPGTAGVGGAGGVSTATTSGGGGGGGWYGGGGGAATASRSSGGGGGSSHVTAGATAVSYGNGVQDGDGKVELTWQAAPVTTTSTTTTTTTPTSTTTAAPGPTGSFGADPDGGITSLTTTAGRSITISTDGWMSSTEVDATMYSEPVHLGRFTASPTGRLTTVLTIPSTAPSGSHRLELTGLGANGSPAVIVLSLTVESTARSATQSAALSFVC